MARNGAGTYNLPAGNPVTTGTTISSTWANTTLSDMANALTGSLAADGQTTPTNNLPMGNYALTSVGNATVRNMYASAGQVQDGTFNYLTGVTGTNAILGSASMGMISYAVGQVFRFIAANSNTGASTLNINSIGAKPIVSTDGSALAAGSIVAGAVAEVFYDGTSFQLFTDANGQTIFSSDITVNGLTVGKGSGSIATNSAFGVSALAANTTGSGNTAIGYSAGSAITTGSKNTILGVYSGNQSGLDIRTLSNYIVLADGDANLRQIIDGSGNVGIGVVPSTWNGYKALQVKGASLASNTNELELSANSYYNSGWKYFASSIGASNYEQYNGIHSWFTAPSGTAGNAVTFTQAMTLDASGNLGIGTASPISLLQLGSGTRANDSIVYTSTANGAYKSGFVYEINGLGAGFIGENDTGATYLGIPTATAGFSTTSDRPIVFSTDSVERMRVNSSKVSVSINNPTRGIISEFTNTAGSSQTGAQITLTQTNVDSWTFGMPANLSSFSFWNSRAPTADGTVQMSISNLGNLTVAGQISGGYYAPAAGTTAMAFGSYTVTKVTPNATATFTTTVPAAGAIATLIILTSGSSSYTITFGTGFKTTGTLTTGTTTGRNFVISFVSDGTNMLETSRTSSYAA